MNQPVAWFGRPPEEQVDEASTLTQVAAPSRDVVWHAASVTRAHREALNRHRGAVVWLTGLSGSGKSTLAHAVEDYLHRSGCRTFVLDGDNVRHGLCADLDFSSAGRTENIRRVGEVAKLFAESGAIVLTAFISPFARDRERIRTLFSPDEFIEVYCACSVDVCERRDVKGLYRRARHGEVKNFTGISSPYEVPENPDLVVDTEIASLSAGVEQVIAMLRHKMVLL